MVALLHIRPYLFDREFLDLVDMSGETNADTSRVEEKFAPPAPSYSEAEVATARDEGYAAGERAGRTTAERALTARATQILETLIQELRDAALSTGHQRSALIQDATAIALTLCRKLLPHTYRETAGEEIAHLLSLVLPRISDQPHVVVRVAVPLAPALTEPLATAVSAAGFAGAITVVADDALAEGDCRIEWAQGGVIRDAATLLHEIETVVDQTIGRHPEITSLDALPVAAQSPEPGGEPVGIADTNPTDGASDAPAVLINPSQRADADG